MRAKKARELRKLSGYTGVQRKIVAMYTKNTLTGQIKRTTTKRNVYKSMKKIWKATHDVNTVKLNWSL